MQTETVVAKFGGTSLANAEMFRRVARIILSDFRRRVVVPSAPGGNPKITNLLYLVYDGNRNAWAEVKRRFLEIESSLELNVGMQSELDIIEKNIVQGTSADYLASRGEYLSGLLLATLLGYEFVDAVKVIKFDARGKVDPITYQLIAERCQGLDGFIIPGFYGSNPDGSIRTFSRGGSDITGAIVANALDAGVYENWTDVKGVLMADPKVVDDPLGVEEMTYAEMEEMALSGANVLHADSVLPAMKKNIPINVRCTFMPNHPGTMIVAHRENGKQRIVGIIGRKGYSAVHFAKHGINREVGVVRDVLNVFVELNLSFDVITPGFHQFDISVANELLKEGKGEELLSGIRVRMCPDELSLITGLALVAVVGLGMAKRPGTMAKVTTAMAEIGVNIRLSAQGSSENSIIFGIDEDLLDVTICAIYKAFC